MKSLLLFGLVAIVSAVTTNIANIAHDHLFHSVKKLQSFSLERPIVNPAPHLLVANATQCLQAWMQLDAVFNSSCGNITQLYAPNVTDVDVAALVNAQCVVQDPATGLTCAQKITTAITQFSNACSGAGLLGIDAATLASLNLWLLMAKLPCLTDSGTYCYPIFRSSLDTFFAELNSGAAITDTVLDQVCVPCVLKVVDTLATWGIIDFVTLSAQLKIGCTERNGEYCFPVFMNATHVNGLKDTASLDLVCDECTRVIAYRLWLANELLGASVNLTLKAELEAFLALAGWVCQQNNNDQYCYLLIEDYDYSKIGSACQGVAILGCPGSQCQTAIQQFKNTLGCCFGTWFSFLEFYYTYNYTAYAAQFNSSGTVTTPAMLETVVEDLCQIPIPDGCAKQHLLVTWQVTNILLDWYNAHQAWFESQFHNVVAYVLSVDPSLVVNITSSYDSAHGAVVVRLEITGFNDQDVTAYAVYLSNAIQVGQDSNDVVVGIKETGTDPQCSSINSPITVSAQSVTVCNDNTCWGCSVTPSFSLFSLLLLLLAYFH